MRVQRILFTGGGSAGHVIVNLALIPEFRKDGWKVDYIGSKNGIERELIEQLDGVTYHPISTGKLRRYLSKENIKDPFKVAKGVLQAYRILGKRKPSVIFSKGGFVSVPVLIASWMRRVPAVIHESDYTPGLANILAVPFAQKVLATFPETMHYLPEKKAEWVGAVVREQLFQGNKAKGLRFAGLTGEKPVLLVMGGSGGSHKLNEAIRDHLDTLLNTYQIIHICGKKHVDESITRKDYTQFEYVNDELNHLFAATDFVLSRAGSNAIFEFLALKKPMLLIPLSRQASRGDQIVNAESFKKQGYARVLEEEDMKDDRIVKELLLLKQEKGTILKAMESYESNKAKETVIRIIKESQK
ncbi:undecaprenyldiphospho-muramoylpentapeptide beta-N-acetylglucosaminyltransferase [Aquibacillus sp. 3ASR75-11]|uniref:UDP-N-acetylglucosamine--N-acetylmuramyl-(pentapeptide) pyrophosphoryl-undecaprenol N-acetylglucosamine transferase n=1 Tax=Terrihalobacillus insolitus TaxID=2950438 RepID=A0A9X4ALU8_9BACI|nr:undecaprenyldiphospho-muramoylpentapeptide beta-N-acetylglucosaminyltransferase [Terrihalobacillus insolitus]MDC3413612.1 undecaprenyldiphospho-muramoylpentapeptide beta-N-acetylglucosaminyltransferase [Terrihalobacillus insolitus]MDC3424631.1 undecaprenyldiphospho-muramoylpentapeptide beta-N-acetylglucosaminyltransferase [Terrihalobacillus insolitus]